MHPVERLTECDKVLKTVNKSLFSTYIFPLLINCLSFHIAPIAKLGFKNVLFGACFSNIYGSGAPIFAFEEIYRILDYGSACGTFDGNTGVYKLH